MKINLPLMLLFWKLNREKRIKAEIFIDCSGDLIWLSGQGQRLKKVMMMGL